MRAEVVVLAVVVVGALAYTKATSASKKRNTACKGEKTTSKIVRCRTAVQQPLQTHQSAQPRTTPFTRNKQFISQKHKRAKQQHKHTTHNPHTTHTQKQSTQVVQLSPPSTFITTTNATTTNTTTMKTPKEIALFDIDEIEVGSKLGSGGYNDVFEITGFKPKQDRMLGKNRRLKKHHQEARKFLIERAVREETGELGYAIKHVKASLLLDKERFECGAMDLEQEAEFLSTLDHPNILKVRGWATNGYESYFKQHRHDAYFLIVDRLTETLTDRIERWAKDFEAGSNELLIDQLKVASSISHALEYLHNKGIVYRDLKPDNIGFDVHGDLKIFDFGLARKLPNGYSDEVFEMSGKVGTARYMAPEVCLCQPYNVKADIYSFAHVLWEILSLVQPYDEHNKHTHREMVIRGGERPSLDNDVWSQRLKMALSKAWHVDLLQRPRMRVIRSLLSHEIEQLGGVPDAPVVPERGTASRRLSTHSKMLYDRIKGIVISDKDNDNDNEDTTEATEATVPRRKSLLGMSLPSMRRSSMAPRAA